jgi:hypothetical protein
MEIKSKTVRTLIEEEYEVSFADKTYRYIDFVGEDGKMTSWSMIDEDNKNVIADEPEVVQIIAAVQNEVDRYNNRTTRHQEIRNEQQHGDNDTSRDTGADQDNG